MYGPSYRFLGSLVGFESLLLCLILVIPFSIFAKSAGLFSERVHEFPKLYHPPYSPYIKAGTEIPFITSCTVTVWIVFFFFPQFWGLRSKRFWWLAVTLLRIAAVVCLALSAEFQSRYLPLPLGSCENDGKWRDPTNVPDGTLTFFKEIPTEIHEHNGGLRIVTTCERLVWLWKYEMALAVLIGLSVFSSGSIFIWFGRFPSGYFNQASLDTWSLGPYIRFSAAYMRRRKLRRETRSTGGLSRLSRILTGRKGEYQNVDVEMGSVPQPVDGTSSNEQCPCATNDKNTHCWGCGIQICNECKVMKTIPPPRQPHSGCKVACSKCFFKKCCRTEAFFAWSKPVTCTEHGDWSKGLKEQEQGLVDMNLCRDNCAKLSKFKLFDVRKERVGAAFLNSDEFAPIICDGCGATCRTGSKIEREYWWCCPYCEGVCDSDVHSYK